LNVCKQKEKELSENLEKFKDRLRRERITDEAKREKVEAKVRKM